MGEVGGLVLSWSLRVLLFVVVSFFALIPFENISEKIIRLIPFILCVSVLPACLHVMCVLGARGGQRGRQRGYG